MKAPRGCENLKAQAVGLGRLDHHAAASSGETLKGPKPHGRRCRMAHGKIRASGLSGNRDLYAAARCLGTSEEEPKPKRGSREAFNCFSGGLEREDPAAQPSW